MVSLKKKCRSEESTSVEGLIQDRYGVWAATILPLFDEYKQARSQILSALDETRPGRSHRSSCGLCVVLYEVLWSETATAKNHTRQP